MSPSQNDPKMKSERTSKSSHSSNKSGSTSSATSKSGKSSSGSKGSKSSKSSSSKTEEYLDPEQLPTGPDPDPDPYPPGPPPDDTSNRSYQTSNEQTYARTNTTQDDYTTANYPGEDQGSYRYQETDNNTSGDQSRRY